MSAGGIVSEAVHREPLGDVNRIELQGTKVEVLKYLQRKKSKRARDENVHYPFCLQTPHHNNPSLPRPRFLLSLFILNNDPREEGWGWSEKGQPVLLLISPKVSPRKMHWRGRLQSSSQDVSTEQTGLHALTGMTTGF